MEKAQQQLDLRAEVIIQQLASLGLQCRRLAGYELASLYYSCLTPDRALRYPLPSQAFASVGQPTRVKQRSTTGCRCPCARHRVPTFRGRATTTTG